MEERLQKIYEILDLISKFESRREGGAFSKSFQTVHQLLHEQSKSALTPSPNGANAISFRYTIPAEICIPRNEKKEQPRQVVSAVTLSALLSMFDEVTSWLIMCVDRRKRSGVSIALGCHLADVNVAMPGAGDVIEVRARVDKIGRNLGFSSFEARRLDTTCQRICIGYHTKFLPMGWLYETTMSSYLLFSVTRVAVSYFSTSNENNEANRRPCLLSELLKIIDGGDGHGDDDDSKHSYSFNITDDHCNTVGTMYGGCQAMVYEEVGRRILSSRTSNVKCDNEFAQLESIHIDYLSSENKGVNIEFNVFYMDADRALMRVEMKSNSSVSRAVSRCKMTWRFKSNNAIPRASM